MSYVWDVASGPPVILQDSQGNTYEYGQGLILQDNAGTPSWYLQDGLGSTVGLTDNSGALTATYSYDAYGAVASTTGSPTATFTFDGEQTDASGLMYLRARYDDPGTGRFVTQDPSVTVATDPGSLNRYAYGEDNPAMVTDPFGLCSTWPPSKWGDCPQKAVEKAAAPVAGFVERFGTVQCLGFGLDLLGTVAGSNPWTIPLAALAFGAALYLDAPDVKEGRPWNFGLDVAGGLTSPGALLTPKLLASTAQFGGAGTGVELLARSNTIVGSIATIVSAEECVQSVY